MNDLRRTTCWIFLTALGLMPISAKAIDPINLVVMDPMALPLSCACVQGKGQRRYEPLANAISARLGVEVNLLYEESLQLALRRNLPTIDLVVGKHSVVLADSKATGLSLRATAALVDQSGETLMAGVVLVSNSSPAQKLSDLAGLRVAISSPEHVECHRAAKALFAEHDVDVQWIQCDSIESAVYSFADGESEAVVVSDYLPELLEGCGKIEKGSTRILASTDSVAGVQLFFSSKLDSQRSDRVLSAAVTASRQTPIRESLESRSGFVPLEVHNESWPDWRGPNRAGQSKSLPLSLEPKLEVLWRAKLTGPAMAGISATKQSVLVAAKSADFEKDLFQAFDADSGTLIWTIEHDASDRMEYTNAPRATPVIFADRVLLQSAFGKLWCVELASGKVVWTKHLVHDFGGKVPTWGYSVPPLVVGDQVIVAPGSADASVVSLSATDGKTRWKSPGHAPAYAPFISGVFGGKAQIVGYDSAGLGGWDLQTGERLWELVPPDASDFHVGTPVVLDDGLLLATENNAMRHYRFESSGKLIPQPISVNLDCAPDTCTPVIAAANGTTRVFCSAYGEMFCVDANHDLKTIWSVADDRFYDHTCLIAGNQRVLMWGSECDLLLFDVQGDEMKIVSQSRPMEGEHPESMSHPALVGDRIYLRSQYELVCLQFPGTASNGTASSSTAPNSIEESQ